MEPINTVSEEKIYTDDSVIRQSLSPYNILCRTHSVEYPVNKFTGDVLFSTGFLGRVWLARYRLVYESYLVGNKYIIDDRCPATWLVPAFASDNRIIASWELDDNPNDSLGVTENVMKRFNYKLIYNGSYYGIYTSSMDKVYGSSSMYTFPGIAIGPLAAWRAGLPPSHPLFFIVVALFALVSADYESKELYRYFGTFRITLASARDIVYAHYAVVERKYTVDGKERIVPAFILVLSSERLA
ncbi:MAG: hypothetical protein ACK4H7_00660 [Acidilobaceae archaeon]